MFSKEHANRLLKIAYVPLSMGAQQAMGGMPPAGPEGQPPMDPAMMQGGGMPPMGPEGMPPQGGEMPPMDPSMGGMPPQSPMPGPDGSINGTFPPVPAEQLPGAAPAAPAGEEGDIDSMLPGFSDFMSRTEQQANKQGKINQRVIKELSGVRGDLQGVMRELAQFTDNQDTLLARLTDLANRLERHMAATTGMPIDRGM